MKTLLYTSHSWNVTNSKSIFQHIDFIPGQIDVLTSLKSLTFSFDNPRFFGKVGNPIFKDYLDNYQQKDTWREFYEKIDVSQYKDYDNIYVIAPPVYALYGIDDYEKVYSQWSDLLDSKRELKFNSHGLPLLHMMVLAKASRIYIIPFFQYNFEVTGINFGKVKDLEPFEYQMFHGYRYRHLDYATTLQEYYQKNSKKDEFDLDFLGGETEGKCLDFAFCYFVFERQKQIYRDKAVSELKEKILHNIDPSRTFLYEYLKDDKGLKTIPRDDYLRKLSKARYTYIIPSFQKDVFSIDRFIDALGNDCLPLINPLVKTEEVEETYGVDLSPLKSFDLFDEDRRLELLDHFKQKMLNVKKLPELKDR